MDLRTNFDLYKRLKRENGIIAVDRCARYDTVVVPESSSRLVRRTAEQLGSCVVEVRKRAVPELLRLLDRQPMQRPERAKLYRLMSEMGSLSMHEIPGNQRHRFRHILFEQLDTADCGTVLLLDDSSFSGTTMAAMCYAVSHYDDTMVLFSYS